MDNLKQTHIDQKEFEFVQKDEKLYDTKFETKPIGYFKDAMIRFSKNKVNVTAAYILFFIILLAIFVPVFTTKNWENQKSEEAFLPPRIPLLEKIGIFDGYRKYNNQTSDGTIMDEETGLYLPNGFDPQFIDLSTLTNSFYTGTLKDPNYVGGTNIIQLKGNSTLFRLRSDVAVEMEPGMFFILNLDSISNLGGETIEVSIRNDAFEVFILGQVNEAGIHRFTLPSNLVAAEYVILISLQSTAFETYASLKSITITSDLESDSPEYYSEGYSLSQYIQIVGQSGDTYTRRDAVVIRTSFRYDVYSAVIERRMQRSVGSAVYYQTLADNPGMMEGAIVDPDNPDGLIFPEGSPYTKMIRQSSPIPTPGGGFEYSFIIQYRYGTYVGYEKLPYFIFGTDQEGKDLFAVTWAGIRTSLFIGVIVSLINISIGIVYGAIEGYYGGKVDLLMERFAEIIGRIPLLVVLSIFYAIMGPGFLTLAIILVISGWLGIASVTRTQFYRYKGREYVLASRTLGAKDSRLIFRHILPNGLGTIITTSILMIPGVIFTESTLAFLGFGLGEGQDINLGLFTLSGRSLGVILNRGQESLGVYPHLVVYPAIIVSILMITFNMFGNALRDAFNPALRGTE